MGRLVIISVHECILQYYRLKYTNDILFISVPVKIKYMNRHVFCSAPSSDMDWSKRFTLYNLDFRVIYPVTLLVKREHYSYTTTVYVQVDIDTAEWTGAT